MTHKPLPILSDMPWHVKQKIVGFTDPYTQRNLQLCTKELQKVVDKTPCAYETLKITLNPNKMEISIYFGGWIDESDNEEVKGMKISFQNQNQQGNQGNEGVTTEKTIRTRKTATVPGSILENGIEYLKKVFYKQPRSLVTVETVELVLNDEVLKPTFLLKLQELCRPGLLFASNLILRMAVNPDDLISILQNFQPGTLKGMQFGVPGDQGKPVLTELPALLQWQQARELGCLGFCVTLPYEEWKHLEVMYMRVESMDLETLQDVIERFGKSQTWDRACFSIDELSDDLWDYIQGFDMYYRKWIKNANGTITAIDFDVENCKLSLDK